MDETDPVKSSTPFANHSAAKAVAIALFAMLLSFEANALAALDADKEGQLAGEASALFEKNEWKEAAPIFSQLYKETGKPTYLWNLARCHHFLGELDEAISAYRQYLAEVPNAPAAKKRTTNNYIAQLEFTKHARDSNEARAPRPEPADGAIAPATAAATAPATVPPATAPPAEAPRALSASSPTPANAAPVAPPSPSAAAAPSTPAAPEPAATPPARSSAPPSIIAQSTVPQGSPRLRAAGVSIGAAGLVGVGAGLYFGLRARSLGNQVSSAPLFDPSNDSAGKTAHTLQFVMYGVGAAALAVGGILYYAGRGMAEPSSSVALSPMLSPGITGALLQTRF